MKKGKEAQPEVHAKVWCLKRKGHGYDKGHYPIYQNYLIGGGLVPLKPENNIGLSTGAVPWCAIYQVTGQHATDNFHLL